MTRARVQCSNPQQSVDHIAEWAAALDRTQMIVEIRMRTVVIVKMQVLLVECLKAKSKTAMLCSPIDTVTAIYFGLVNIITGKYVDRYIVVQFWLSLLWRCGHVLNCLLSSTPQAVPYLLLPQ